MDRAIINRTHKEAKKHEIVRDLDQTFHKIDELPFDFERRRMSVIVKDEDGVVSMVTKGAWKKCFLYRLMLSTRERLNA